MQGNPKCSKATTDAALNELRATRATIGAAAGRLRRRAREVRDTTAEPTTARNWLAGQLEAAADTLVELAREVDRDLESSPAEAARAHLARQRRHLRERAQAERRAAQRSRLARRFAPSAVAPGWAKTRRALRLVGALANLAGPSWRRQSEVLLELEERFGVPQDEARLSALAWGAALGVLEARVFRGRDEVRSANPATVAALLKRASGRRETAAA